MFRDRMEENAIRLSDLMQAPNAASLPGYGVDGFGTGQKSYAHNPAI
jgi:hypothetical protein